MEDILITLEWMKAKLDQLATDPNLSHDQAINLFETLTETINQKISNKVEFSASEFILACIMYFIVYDLKDEKYCLPADYYKSHAGIIMRRSLSYSDIIEAKERFNNLSNNLLKQISKYCELNEKKSAYFWFESIDKLQHEGNIDLYIQRHRTEYIKSSGKPRVRAGEKQNIGLMPLIPEEFVHQIFYVHYELDPKIVKNSPPLVNRYNADEAAKKLNISKHNLIKFCIDASLGVYLNSHQFKINRGKGSRCNKEMIEAFSDVTYPYSYHGLVRLSKPELEKLYSKAITSSTKSFSLIQLQPSLAEVIQNISMSIELRGKQQITIDDLWFIQDEIQAYVSNKVSSANNQNANENLDAEVEKQERSHGLRDLIKEDFAKAPSIRNQAMWAKLKVCKSPLITNVTSWSSYEPCIEWKSQNGIDQKMSKSTFQKFMSELRSSR